MTALEPHPHLGGDQLEVLAVDQVEDLQDTRSHPASRLPPLGELVEHLTGRACADVVIGGASDPVGFAPAL